MRINSSYGLGDLSKFKEYALKNNLTMEAAADKLGLTNNEKDVLKLVIAREYYKEGNIKAGDNYLNSVESTKGKDKNTVKLVSDLRSMKRFLRYRECDKEKNLVYVAPGKRF